MAKLPSVAFADTESFDSKAGEQGTDLVADHVQERRAARQPVRAAIRQVFPAGTRFQPRDVDQPTGSVVPGGTLPTPHAR